MAESVVPLLLFPGLVSAPLPVADLLRDAYASASAVRLAEVERRTKNAVPLDDKTVWPAVSGIVDATKLAASIHDGAAVRALAVRILDATAQPLAELPPLVIDPALSSLSLVMRTMSARALAMVRARQHQAAAEFDRAGDDHVKRAEANELAYDAWAELVIGSVVEVHGLAPVPVPMSDALVEGLRRSGLLGAIHDACEHFQGLSPGKVSLSGSSPLST